MIQPAQRQAKLGLHIGGGGEDAPRLALALYGRVLLGDALAAIGTEGQAQRGMRRVRKLDEGIGECHRIAGLVVIDLRDKRAHRARRGIVVGETDVGFDKRLGVIENVAAEEARLDDGNVDSQGRELEMQRFRHPLDRELRARIDAEASIAAYYPAEVPSDPRDWT
jgi:hypothetical protein